MKIVDRKFKTNKKKTIASSTQWTSLLCRFVDAQSLQGFKKQLEKSMEKNSIKTIKTKAFG